LIDEDFSDLISSKIAASKSDSKLVCSDESDKVSAKKEEDDEEILKSIERKKTKYTQVAKLYLSLGHFYLLIYDYAKALECYQKFYKFKLHKLQVRLINVYYCFALFISILRLLNSNLVKRFI